MNYKKKKNIPLQVAGKRAMKILGVNCGCKKRY